MITEQSLESLSATFVVKFRVSALSAHRDDTVRNSSSLQEILASYQVTPKLISQYQMSVLSSKLGLVKNSFIHSLPVTSSTPVLPLCDKDTTSGLRSTASYLQIENVKRQLFTDDDKNLSQSFKPCHCLNTKVIDQLTSLQQDIDNSIDISKTILPQESSSLISSDLMGEAFFSYSDDNIISPPLEFSEQCNISSSSVSSIEATSLTSTEGSVESYSDTVSQHFSNEVMLDHHSYALFNKLISIVKLMQHYPVSVIFIAWHRFVQKRKSLNILRADIYFMISHNIMRNTFTLWKLRTCKMLQYKQLEMSFLAVSQKRSLSIALQKWITVYHKQLKDDGILNNLLISRNEHMVKNSFFKWKHNFEISITIRNHMVINNAYLELQL